MLNAVKGLFNRKKTAEAKEQQDTTGTADEVMCCFMGSGGVGLSAVVIQFIQNHFVDEYDPTIEDSYRKQIFMNERTVLFDILDTAGQEEYRAMRGSYYRETRYVFVFMYAINSRASFKELAECFYDDLLKNRPDDNIPAWPYPPCVVVGNKKDLEHHREVTTQQGEDFARGINCPFIETSALTAENVHRLFELIHLQSQRMRNPKNVPIPFAVALLEESDFPKAKKMPDSHMNVSLTAAVQKSGSSVCKVLALQKKWDLSLLNGALVWCCFKGYDDAIEALLDHGANTENIFMLATPSVNPKYIWRLLPQLKRAQITFHGETVYYDELVARHRDRNAAYFFAVAARFEMKLPRDIVALIMRKALPQWMPESARKTFEYLQSFEER